MPHYPADESEGAAGLTPEHDDLAPPPPPPPPTPSSTGLGLREYVILVAAGAFATTFAQQRVLGQLPTTFLLKDHLHLKREDVAFSSSSHPSLGTSSPSQGS